MTIQSRRRPAGRGRKTAARTSAARQRPNLVVVGSPRRRRAIERALAGLDATLRSLSWEDSVADAVDAATLCVVLGEAAPSSRPWKTVATLHRILARPVALAVLVPDDTSFATTRRIYAAGAAVVFEWPRESLVLARVLAEMLGFELVRGAAKRGDGALARAVVAHLRLVSPAFASVDVEIAGGIVSLRGFVDGLWYRHDAERIVAAVPGVRGVIARGVLVRTRVPDPRIRQAVRSVLRGAAASSTSTIAVSVRAGRVVLAGTIGSKHEADHVVELVARIRGVREIECDLVPSRVRQARDATVAARVRKVVETIAGKDRVDVAYFGGAAVLTGRVPTMSTRQSLTAAVGLIANVDRVIDKLVIG